MLGTENRLRARGAHDVQCELDRHIASNNSGASPLSDFLSYKNLLM